MATAKKATTTRAKKAPKKAEPAPEPMMLTGVFFQADKTREGGRWKAILRRGCMVWHVGIPNTPASSSRAKAERNAEGMEVEILMADDIAPGLLDEINLRKSR